MKYGRARRTACHKIDFVAWSGEAGRGHVQAAISCLIGRQDGRSDTCGRLDSVSELWLPRVGGAVDDHHHHEADALRERQQQMIPGQLDAASRLVVANLRNMHAG